MIIDIIMIYDIVEIYIDGNNIFITGYRQDSYSTYTKIKIEMTIKIKEKE